MKSALIFYFSGTGNTWWLGKTLQQKLLDQNIQTHLIEIDSESVNQYFEQIKKYNLVGFGYPIYGSDCPLNYNKFLESLPVVEEKDCFVYTSMLAFSGDGALVAEKLLKRKGFRLKQAVNIIMPNNLKLPYPVIDQFPIFSDEEAVQIIRKAEEKVLKLSEKIANGEKWVEGRGWFGIIGGKLQRASIVFLGWSRWARNFFVDGDSCTLCMLCVNDCPNDNIRFLDGDFVWGEDCVCCLRCYNMCPTDAIQYKKATLDKVRFPRYKGPIKGYITLLQKEERARS